MEKRKWILPLGIVGGVVILCTVAVFVFGALISAKGYSISTGRLYFAEQGTYLIDDEDMAMRVSDCSEDETLFDGYKSGDRVILLHDEVLLTYPSMTGGYKIFRLSKGDGSYKPADEVLGVVTVDENDNGSSVDYEEPSEYKQVTCGNTITTIRFDDGKSFSFMYGNSVEMTSILINLDYVEGSMCDCLPEYTVDTEFGTGYGINLTEGYARFDGGQVDLTQEQVDKLGEIILWAKQEAQNTSFATPQYTFSLTWDVYGISSYDSESGTLIKTNDATNPEEYKTNLKLTEQQYSAIWELISDLDIESYPDEYNPHENGVSIPYMTLILSVKADGIYKTVTAKETILSYETNNEKGQKFLDVCEGIKNILTETDEWKALPEYEFYYH